MQERIDRQRRALQQPSLQVRWHAWLASENGFQPQGGRVPGNSLAEAKALGVSRLNGLADRHRRWRHRWCHRWLLTAVGARPVPASRAGSTELGRLDRAAIRHAPVLCIRRAVTGRQLTLRRRRALALGWHAAVRRHGRWWHGGSRLTAGTLLHADADLTHCRLTVTGLTGCWSL